MSPEVLTHLVTALIGILVGWLAGAAYGRKTGEAQGWQDGYFNRIADDKARRDKSGQFIAIKGNQKVLP